MKASRDEELIDGLAMIVHGAVAWIVALGLSWLLPRAWLVGFGVWVLLCALAMFWKLVGEELRP